MEVILFFLVVVTSIVLGTSFDEGFSESENTYANEKCEYQSNIQKIGLYGNYFYKDTYM